MNLFHLIVWKVRQDQSACVTNLSLEMENNCQFFNESMGRDDFRVRRRLLSCGMMFSCGKLRFSGEGVQDDNVGFPVKNAS